LGPALLAAGLLAVLLLVPGLLGSEGRAPLRVLMGWGGFVLAGALLLGGLWLIVRSRERLDISWAALACAELLLLSLLSFSHTFQADPLDAALAGRGGGLVGWAGSDLLANPLGLTWARVLWGLAALASLAGLVYSLRPPRAGVLATGLTGAASSAGVYAAALAGWLVARGGDAQTALDDLRRRLPELKALWPAPGTDETAASAQPAGRPRRSASRSAPVEPAAPARSDATPGASRMAPRSAGKERAAPPRARPPSLPPLDLLSPPQRGGAGSADTRQRAQTLKQTLAEFGVPVEIVSIKEGPTVTQFGLEPGEVVREMRSGELQRRRVSVHKIVGLSNDLALALAAQSIRIEAPVPGRNYVGVEIPNSAKTLVGLRGILESREFARVASPLALALGRDVSGDPVVVDLARMPHLLIAGATGSGKSVCINALVSSLIMNNGSDRVRFLMVDPKMVELPVYNGIPHLLGPVITDVSQVSGALAWLTLQMDDRYRTFADHGVRNISEYNRKFGKGRQGGPLPYLVLIIDEMADLMMNSAFDVERQICRLAQMSRATGIHLVLATQRPSVDVITGLIKANFPARIAFAVTTQIDSRVILDSPGAEKLLGRGDMLLMTPDSAKLSRIQGCFVSDREIEAVVDFWRAARAEGETPAPASAPWAGLTDSLDPHDQLLEQALLLIQSRSQISTSMLQRQLRVGFPRAARLMEQLEEMGAVGPDEGGGRSRAVLVGHMEDSN
jgi:S-DNA-T family DNA segregation ATPase FtsK/SpoIIIE